MTVVEAPWLLDVALPGCAINGLASVAVLVLLVRMLADMAADTLGACLAGNVVRWRESTLTFRTSYMHIAMRLTNLINVGA